MSKSKKKKRKLADLVLPENLQKRISSYGYDFSNSRYILSVLAIITAAVIFGLLFSLKLVYIAIISLLIVILLPNIILNGYKNMYEHKRFVDVSDYMEQILYSFKVNSKIVSALEDTKTMFTGQMNTVIQEALDYIRAGESEKNLYREALKKIEAYYPTPQLSAIHSYMCAVEKNGGNADDSVDLLLKKKNIWADNILLLQEERKTEKRNISASIFLTMGLAAIFHYVYRSMPAQYNIVGNPVVQIATTVYVVANIFIWYRANKEIAKSWIELEADKESKRAVSYLKMIRSWNEKEERKKSLIFSLPFFITAIPLVITGKTLFAVVVLALGLFLLNQHKIGYGIAYRTVVKEINAAFPRWLMELALLLQGNNIRNSVENSLETAPEILKSEIQEMAEHMRQEPASQEPYLNFLKDFQLGAVQSAMKMLYSISQLGSGEVETQVRSLVERNSRLLDKAEKLENEKKMAGMRGLFYFPQLTVSFQMMVMLALFSVVFFQSTIV